MGLYFLLLIVLPPLLELASLAYCQPKFVPSQLTVSTGVGWLYPSCPLLQGTTDLDSALRWPWPPSGHHPVVYPIYAQVFFSA